MDVDQVNSTEQSTEIQTETQPEQPLQPPPANEVSQPVDMDSSAPDSATNQATDSPMQAPQSQPEMQEVPVSSEMNTEHVMPNEQISESNQEMGVMAAQPGQEAATVKHEERAEQEATFPPASDSAAVMGDAADAPVMLQREQEPQEPQPAAEPASANDAQQQPMEAEKEYQDAQPQVNETDVAVPPSQPQQPPAQQEEQAVQPPQDNAMEVEPKEEEEPTQNEPRNDEQEQDQQPAETQAMDVEMHGNENGNAENEAPTATATAAAVMKDEFPSEERPDAARVTRASQRNADNNNKASNGDGARGDRVVSTTGGGGVAPELVQCRKLLDEFMDRPESEAFNAPVDWEALNLPDYPMIISKPMDLGTIAGKLQSGRYSSSDAFASDIRLVFNNAKKYNTPGSNIYVIAENLLKQFERRFARITKDSTLSGRKRKSAEKAKGMHGDGQESSYKDRQRFTELLQELSAQELGAIVELIDKKSPQALNGSSEDEEELDIEVYHIESSVLKELITFSEKMITKRQKKKK